MCSLDGIFKTPKYTPPPIQTPPPAPTPAPEVIVNPAPAPAPSPAPSALKIGRAERAGTKRNSKSTTRSRGKSSLRIPKTTGSGVRAN